LDLEINFLSEKQWKIERESARSREKTKQKSYFNVVVNKK